MLIFTLQSSCPHLTKKTATNCPCSCYHSFAIPEKGISFSYCLNINWEGALSQVPGLRAGMEVQHHGWEHPERPLERGSFPKEGNGKHARQTQTSCDPSQLCVALFPPKTLNPLCTSPFPCLAWLPFLPSLLPRGLRSSVHKIKFKSVTVGGVGWTRQRRNIYAL